MHIQIRGLVQGVGFRPLVYSLAKEAGYTGCVSNGADGVHIRIQASRPEAEAFIDRIRRSLPSYASITSIVVEQSEPFEGKTFSIVPSEGGQSPDLIIAPDRAICPACRRDIRDPANRRFSYPFTTCLQCGPRYSILNGLPYDRERTAMAQYALCPACASEYGDPADRHHYSQTHSCPDCRIPMHWYDASGRDMGMDQDRILPAASNALASGEIIAVKGLGGFLLMADARRPEVIRRLRERKHRPSKPFALMYPDLHSIRQDAFAGDNERQALESAEGPIVLLALSPEPASGIVHELIAPGLKCIGVMLPPTPLLDLLLQEFPHPVIATSGNVSGSPILHQDDAAIRGLQGIADHFLGYDREIVTPQDDSVVQFASPEDKTPVILRRSRGMAPAFHPHAFPAAGHPVLALGAHMKGAMAVQVGDNLHVSPWLGNLESYEAQETYRHAMHHLLGLLEVTPDVILADRHPGYFTSGLGAELGMQWGIPVESYFHHQAHFAAVLAEHQMLESSGPILGVIWDGTGYGEDGQSWGGEFMIYQDGVFKRMAHLAYAPVILGDKMALEPRLSALAYCHDVPGAQDRLRDKFSGLEWELYLRKAAGPAVRTRSMGRLFDAVASLLGLSDRQSYEGEAAMRLEALAWQAAATEPYKMDDRVWTGSQFGRSILQHITGDLDDNRPRREIAGAFHRTLVAWIANVARQAGVRKVAVTGGVWQNALLNTLASQDLGGEFELMRHRSLSPNDECIPFGQLALWHAARIFN